MHNVSPGFSKEVIEKLTKKVASMSEDEKQCVLVFDEMSIKKALEYDSKCDVIEGFEDLGPLGRSNSIGTHALLFLLRGLKYQWKCPFAYFISKNCTKTHSLALLLDMCLDNVFKTGLDLRAIVCDLGSNNAAAMRLLGVSEEKPYMFYGSRKIFFLFDVPHLIKCIRNNLMNHDFIVGGKVASWDDIRHFYDVDRNSLTDCRAAPKLTERHLNPQNFQKMSVKLATQVFSSSVSRGMHTAYVVGAISSPTCQNTANLCGMLNDIFDCLNSTYCYDSNPLKRPISEANTNVIKCLEDAVISIRSWKLQNSKINPPCFSGLVLSIRSVLLLYADLKAENNSYLLTGRLNQDVVENTFGVLRQRGGYNCNPSAKQFRRNLQHMMSIRLMDPPGPANCEPDADVNLNVQAQPFDRTCQHEDLIVDADQGISQPLDEREPRDEGM